MLFLAAWLLYGAVSLLWAPNTLDGVRTFFNLLAGVSLVMLARVFLAQKRALDGAAKAWLITFGIFLVIALFEHVTRLHLPISRFAQGSQPHLAFRPTTVFVNENNYATFMSLSFPFLLAWFRCQRNWLYKLLIGTGLTVGIYMLFVTGSRINYMALVAIILIFSLGFTSRGKKIKVLAILCLLVAFVYMATGYIMPAMQGLLDKNVASIFNIYRDLAGRNWAFEDEYVGGNRSFAVRVNLMRNGFHFVRQTWGLGAGLGNFDSYLAAAAVYDTDGIATPHCWWLELAVEHGLLVTLGFAAFYISLLRQCLSDWRRAKGAAKRLPEALCISMAIFPLVAFSPSRMVSFAPMWLLFALALGQHTAGKEINDAGANDIPSLSVQS